LEDTKKTNGKKFRGCRCHGAQFILSRWIKEASTGNLGRRCQFQKVTEAWGSEILNYLMMQCLINKLGASWRILIAFVLEYSRVGITQM
jgi:hypothetical protein